jgi:hypothetical protein
MPPTVTEVNEALDPNPVPVMVMVVPPEMLHSVAMLLDVVQPATEVTAGGM